MPGFTYQIHEQGSVSVIEVSGDVDMSVAGRLTEVLEPLVAVKNVVLDCSNVTFFDSMGLRVAVNALNQATKAGTTFTLVPSQPVARVLELAGVVEIFTNRQNSLETGQ